MFFKTKENLTIMRLEIITMMVTPILLDLFNVPYFFLKKTILDGNTKRIKLNRNKGKFLFFIPYFLQLLQCSIIFNQIYPFLDYLTKEFGFEIHDNINSSKFKNNSK